MAPKQPDPDKALLGLTDVLRVAGISKLLLHAWERRYGLAPCGRSETGRRFYTRAQAEHFRLLKCCSDAGYRIGTLIDLPLDDLKRIEEDHRSKLSLAPLLNAVQQFDHEALRQILMARTKAEGPDGFVRRTAVPLLREVGLLWANGTMTIAAEHLVTSKITHIIGAMLVDCPAPADDAPRLVTTTPEGERHEIGALIAALMAQLRGWNAVYLGADLPTKEIAFAARNRHADLVCLSALAGKRRILENNLHDLRAALPAQTSIWLGGPAHAGMPTMDGVRFFPHLDAYIDALSFEPKTIAQSR